jgi:hypothetical protein
MVSDAWDNYAESYILRHGTTWDIRKREINQFMGKQEQHYYSSKKNRSYGVRTCEEGTSYIRALLVAR